MNDAALMTTNGHAATPYTEARIQLLKRTMADGKMSNDELALFVEVCKRTGLDPFRRQVYAIVRGGKMTIQTGIDGFRCIAERSGKYGGQVGPFWCGADGEWTDVWLKAEPPAAAKVGILRTDFKEPMWGVAKFSSYAQENLWRKMPEVMIAKVAEALAIRKAFPEDASGLYSDEEMQQADAPRTTGPTPDALFQQRKAQLEAIVTEAEFKAVTGAIGSDKRAGLLDAASLDELHAMAKKVKGRVLVAKVRSAATTEPAPDDGAVAAGPACATCGKPTGADAVRTIVDNRPGWRHPGCPVPGMGTSEPADSPPPEDWRPSDEERA